MKTGINVLRLNILGALALSLLMLSGSTQANEKFHSNGHNQPHGLASSKKVYDSLFAIAVPLSNSPEGREVVEHCLNAYGGVDHLKKITSIREDWRMLSMMSQDTIDVIRTVAPGRKYRIFRPNAGGSESRMINGNHAWFQSADTLIELDGGRYKAELFSYLVLSMPLALKTEPFSDMRYGQRADDPLHYIFLEKTDSLMVIIGIDPETYYITRAEGVIRQGEQSFVFENHFGDHKKYDGYVFPTSLVNISMGLTVGKSVLKEVTINSGLTDSDFMPDKTIGF